MNFIDKMVERFIKLNRRMKRWQRVVSVLAAVVVFATTYALILPAITLDKETATAEPGIEVAASENEAGEAGTVFEEEEPSAEEIVQEEEPEEAVAEENVAEEDSSSESGSEDAEAVDTEAADEGATSETVPADETEQTEVLSTEEAAAYGTTEAAIAAVTGRTAEEVKLITEDTQLTYEADDYIVYADFGESAKLPEGVQLRVKEITKESDPEAYEAYYQKALSEMQDKYDENVALSFAKFYDIAFVYEGVEIEPSGNVNVRIEYKQAVEIEKNTAVDTIHFDKNDDEKAEVINSDTEGSEKEVEAVKFESDQFSVYGVVGASLETEFTISNQDGEDVTYLVTVTYGPEAKIPEGSTLRVTPFAEGTDEYEYARNAVLADKKEKGEGIILNEFGFAAMDISIISPEGNEIEPEAPVQVDLKIKSLPGVEDLDKIKNTLEIKHHVEAENGVIVDKVYDGSAEASFKQNTDKEIIAQKNNDAVDPNSVSEDDFADAVDIQEIDTSFTVDEFSTYSINWNSNRNRTTVHYGYLDGNTFVEFSEQASPVNVNTNYRTYLVYDFDGYEYSGYTYYRTSASSTPASGGTRIQAQLRYSSSNWRYHAYSTSESSNNWNSLANNSHIYVVYNQKPEPEMGGTAQIDDADPSDWPQDPETPLFSKSSINNTNGTNTISLSISGGEEEYEKSTKANVIVVFDVSGSMDEYLGRQTRLATAKTAVNNMANTLLNGDIDGVKMALITFSTTSSATPVQGFTDDYGTYRSAVNGLSADGGTNWEQALYNANRLEVDDDAATFVVFVTDGDPTYRLSRYNAPDSEIQGYNRDARYFAYNIFGEGDGDTNNRNFDAAAEEVKSILDKNKTFYAIGVSSDVTKVQNLVDEAGGGTAYLATDAAALEEAFENITHSIKTTLGFGDVEITDGITELTNVEMKVMQEVDPDSFTYYKVTSAGQEEWDPASEGAGLASYNNETGAVIWDLGEGFQLEEGVTYMVKFRAWPSQEAYDLVADLNNGVKVYASGSENSITEEERKQIVELAPPSTDADGKPVQGSYALKTNTDTVNATYSQTSSTGETVTVSGDTGLIARYEEGTIENMDLASQLIKIVKIFDQSLDPRDVESVTLKLQRKINDNDHTMADYNVPGTNSPNIVLGKDNNWEFSFFAAPGFIADGEILDKGYQFTVTEPDIGEHTVRYDLIPEIVNPMVVDGQPQLIGDGDGNQALTAINRTRSAVEIHKTLYDVDGSTQIYPDTEFTITGELLGPDGTPFTSQETAAPVAYYLYDKDGNATTGREHFADSSNITFTLKAGEFIRFVNVPEGCTFEFTESSMPDNYELQSLGAVGRQRAEDDPAYTYSIELTDAEAHLVEGTASISTTDEGIIGNTNYKLDFYNKRVIPLPEVELEKVDADDNTSKLNGAKFALHKDSATGPLVTADGNGNPIDITTGNKAESEGPDGWYLIGLLPAGTYYMVETQQPNGYVPDETPVIITVTKETDSYSVTATKNGQSVISGPTEGVYTITVDNVRATKYVKVFKYETGSSPEKALEGAVFTLTGPEGTGISYTGLTTDDDGYLVFGDNQKYAELPLDTNAYTLTETKAPDGYNKLTESITFTITSDGVTGTGSGYSVVTDTETIDGKDVTVYVIKVQNSAGTELPMTGGPGTLLYTLGGLMLILASALMYGFRMRRGERRIN